MLVKIILIVALIILVSRKFLQKSIKTEDQTKNDDVIDAEFTEIKDDSTENK